MRIPGGQGMLVLVSAAIVIAGTLAGCTTTAVAGSATYAGTTSVASAPNDFNLLAEVRGKLPESGVPDVGAIKLPPGKLLYANEMYDSSSKEPLAWLTTTKMSNADLATLWFALVKAFPTSGLWPIIADREPYADVFEPADFGGTVITKQLDAATVLRNSTTDDPPEWEFTTLAQPESGIVTLPDSQTLIGDQPAGLYLVPATRPSDVFNTLGWSAGGVTYEEAGAEYSAVLKSWEDRFGAYLIGMGQDTLRVFVSNPPSSYDQAKDLAREYGAFCWDTSGAVDDLSTIADYLQFTDEWWLWWD